MDSDTVGFFLTFFALILAVWLFTRIWLSQTPSLAVQYDRFLDEKDQANTQFVQELLNPPVPN